MRLKNFMIVVENISKSKAFYKEMFAMETKVDFGENAILSSGLVLQQKDVWEFTTNMKVENKTNNCQLYFESDNLDLFLGKIDTCSFEIEIATDLIERSFGQRLIRIYDLDGHLIEVAETEESVVRRFLNMGMAAEEVAEKMRLPVDCIEEMEKKITIAS